jgi:hypothetical protein
VRALGTAVQVDPIKSTLKAPITNPLTLKYDEPLSTFAFKFNLRRYNLALLFAFAFLRGGSGGSSSPVVGRCRFTGSG